MRSAALQQMLSSHGASYPNVESWQQSMIPDPPEASLPSIVASDEKKPLTANSAKAFSKQFYKTRLCPYYMVGYCRKGIHCTYAHDKTELAISPDLSKTKLCTSWQKGTCTNPLCRYAHGWNELRCTTHFYKTRLCHFWAAGDCNRGRTCRHAHGIEELQSQLDAMRLASAGLTSDSPSVCDIMSEISYAHRLISLTSGSSSSGNESHRGISVWSTPPDTADEAFDYSPYIAVSPQQRRKFLSDGWKACPKPSRLLSDVEQLPYLLLQRQTAEGASSLSTVNRDSGTMALSPDSPPPPIPSKRRHPLYRSQTNESCLPWNHTTQSPSCTNSQHSLGQTVTTTLSDLNSTSLLLPSLIGAPQALTAPKADSSDSFISESVITQLLLQVVDGITTVAPQPIDHPTGYQTGDGVLWQSLLKQLVHTTDH